MLLRKQGMTTLMELVMITVAAIVILASLSFFWNFISSILRSPSEDEFTQVEDLMLMIKDLAASEAYFVANKSITLMMPEGHMLVAYQKGEEPSMDLCGEEPAPKPPDCGDKACLCLHREMTGDDDFGEQCTGSRNSCKPPKSCTTIDADYIFALRYNEQYSKANKIPESFYKNVLGQEYNVVNENYKGAYSYLFIYEECDDHWSDEQFGFQSVYIEKFTDPKTEKTHIFLAFPDDNVLDRHKEMNDKYGPKSVQRYDREILKLLSENKPKEALDEYAKFREIFTNMRLSRESYLGLTKYVSSLSEYELEEVEEEAVNVHRDFIGFYDTDPALPEIRYSLASLYRTLDDYDSAIEVLDELIASHPSSNITPAARELRQALIDYLAAIEGFLEADYERSISRLKAVTDGAADDEAKAEAHLQLGIIYGLSQLPGFGIAERTDQEITDQYNTILTSYTSTDPAGEAAYRLGDFHYSKERYEQACDYYVRALTDFPRSMTMTDESVGDMTKESLLTLFDRLEGQELPGSCSQAFLLIS
jgi:tetratricopeptide (TPR) repeat protein